MNQNRTTSPRKIAANRQNAQRSTGPRTPEGKRRVRWNALKHGVLAAQVLLAPGEDPESLDQFRRLLAQLRRDRRPRGMLENMLVEKIAVCHWRLGRVLRSEAGAIRSEMEAAERQRQQDQADDLQLTLAAVGAGQPAAHHELKQTPSGLNLLLTLLKGAHDELSDNPQRPPDLKMLRACFGNPKWLSQEVLEEPNGLQNLRRALEVEAGYLRQDLRAVERKEAREWQARQASLNVPGKEDCRESCITKPASSATCSAPCGNWSACRADGRGGVFLGPPVIGGTKPKAARGNEISQFESSSCNFDQSAVWLCLPQGLTRSVQWRGIKPRPAPGRAWHCNPRLARPRPT